MEFFLKIADKIMEAFFASKKCITPSFVDEKNVRVKPIEQGGWSLEFADGRESLRLNDGDVLVNNMGRLEVIERNSPKLEEYAIWHPKDKVVMMNLQEFITVVDSKDDDWYVEDEVS